MKVCIDSCVFGASIDVGSAKSVLDIGTGTGLLSLMLAQKSKDINIDAVEIDLNAFEQAKENFQKSPYQGQITAHYSDIKKFGKTQYDLIVVNPPFFEASLLSPEASKNRAKHQVNLSLKELSEQINLRMAFEGKVAIMLPPNQMVEMINLLKEQGINSISVLSVRHQMETKTFREVRTFSRTEFSENHKTLVIKEADNKTYTNDFQALLKDYYIIF